MLSIKWIMYTILVIFILNVASEVTILTPNSKFYGVVNETLLITWKSNGNDVPQSITIKLISKTQTNLFTGEYAVGQSIPTSSGKYEWRIIDNLVGENNWILKFYNALSELNEKNNSTIAQSHVFSIKPAGTKLPANDTSTTSSDSINIISYSFSSLFIFFVSFIPSIIIIISF